MSRSEVRPPVAVALAVWLALAVIAAAPMAAQAPAIRVGVIQPLSGPNARVGQDNLDAIKIAVDQVNTAGGLVGGRKIELKIGDDRSVPSEGVSVARQLIDRDRVVAVIGAFNSSVCAAIQDVMKEKRVPELVTGCTADILTEKGNTFFFRPTANNSMQAVDFVKWVVSTLRKRRVVVLYQNTDWGRSLNDIAVRVARESGGTVLASENYAPENADFTATLTRIRSLNPEVIFTAALETDGSIILRQAVAVGLRGSLFYGWGGFGRDELHQLAAGAEEGVVTVDYFLGEEDCVPKAREFAKLVRQRLGKPANTFHAQAYDAATILFDAIRRANSTIPAQIRDAIARTKNFSGVLGRSMTFDEKGQIHGVELAVVQWKGGRRAAMGPCIRTGKL